LSPPAIEVDLGGLGFERGGHLLVKRALAAAPAGEPVRVVGGDASLRVHLTAWCRARGHALAHSPSGPLVSRGDAEAGRWRGAPRAGAVDPRRTTAVLDQPDLSWGVAPRGARVEPGAAAARYTLHDKDVVWSDDAARVYAQAAAAQWDPATAIDWAQDIDLPDEIEDAVVQVMTYLIENETAALQIPAAFVARLHPHFREVMQVLAIQAADEARHVEVFTRRAARTRDELGLSTVGGRRSLQTLLDEPDFALASFLLSVLGEGSFLSLLQFLVDRAPDPLTAAVCRLAAQDEARHVAFGLAHLRRHAERDPTLLARLAMATERRHDALRDTAGLNEEVFDALVILAAGSWAPAALADGHDAVMQLQADMDRGRRVRLGLLGFSTEEAARLSGLHTRNFM
jgi:hypothetical protein